MELISMFPSELQVDEAVQAGLPRLYGMLDKAATQALTVVLRIHNRAGIPIIEGSCRIETGHQQCTFSDLHVLGIEAYAHASEAEREQVCARVWTRRAYGTLSVQPFIQSN
jgi:hypothetical protein